VTATLPDSSTPALDPPLSTLDFPEPPPLEEWLQGREILTVKQDGTAMFTKIQDALDALKRGQVVEVLDKGPYLETLDTTMVADSGLVTRVKSHIVCDRWSDRETSERDSNQFLGHRFRGDVRLSGLVFSSSKMLDRAILLNSVGGSLTLEHCVFPTVSIPTASQSSLTIGAGATFEPRNIVIRNCVFGGQVYISTFSEGWSVDVLRNYFVSETNCLSIGCYQGQGDPHTVRVSCNVFDRNSNRGMNFSVYDGQFNASGWIEQNTILSRAEAMGVGHGVPNHAVLFRHNLVTSNEGILLVLGAEQFRDRVRESIVQEWNGYSNPVSDADGLPLTSRNIIAPPGFISLAPDTRDFARIPRDGPCAKLPRRDGGPTFAGALPPGPAPPEGDWFTRLLDRWKEAQEDLKRMGLEK